MERKIVLTVPIVVKYSQDKTPSAHMSETYMKIDVLTNVTYVKKPSTDLYS